MKKYKWRGINYSSKIDDWKTLDKNNPAIALNILYIKGKEIQLISQKLISFAKKRS